MIIGKIGPEAKPLSANRAIDNGSDGTRIAASSDTDIAAVHTRVNRRWSNRSASRAPTSRPTVSPPHSRDRAPVATSSGARSRKRTSQLETPPSDAT
jgi:hypothetical protein